MILSFSSFPYVFFWSFSKNLNFQRRIFNVSKRKNVDDQKVTHYPEVVAAAVSF